MTDDEQEMWAALMVAIMMLDARPIVDLLKRARTDS